MLLLTAHRAKGLEFDHVAVLDGNWHGIGPDEDPDAPRRLYYVAMTRARKTLTLARFKPLPGRPPGLPDQLPDARNRLRRAATGLPAPMAEMARRYLNLTLQDVDIGFAGRRAPDDPVHRAIGALSAGDALGLRQGKSRWELFDAGGLLIGRLAKSFAPPANMQWLSARVAAILVRQADDGASGFRALARCERWEVVLPELVYEPGNGT